MHTQATTTSYIFVFIFNIYLFLNKQTKNLQYYFLRNYKYHNRIKNNDNNKNREIF